MGTFFGLHNSKGKSYIINITKQKLYSRAKFMEIFVTL